MKVTKHFLKEILDETVNEFNEKIINIHNDIEFEFIEKKRFIIIGEKTPSSTK